MSQFDVKMTELADKIKSKNTAVTGKLSVQGMIDAVGNISTGVDLPDGITATPADVKDGVFFIDANGDKVEGEMPLHGAVSVIPSTSAQVLDAGHYTKITVQPALSSDNKLYRCTEVSGTGDTWTGVEYVQQPIDIQCDNSESYLVETFKTDDDGDGVYETVEIYSTSFEGVFRADASDGYITNYIYSGSFIGTPPELYYSYDDGVWKIRGYGKWNVEENKSSILDFFFCKAPATASASDLANAQWYTSFIDGGADPAEFVDLKLSAVGVGWMPSGAEPKVFETTHFTPEIGMFYRETTDLEILNAYPHLFNINGESSVKFGYWTEEGKFQELDLSGDSPVDTGDSITADAVVFDTGKEAPSYGGAGTMDFYKCITVDQGNAYDAYQDVNISGVTAPAGLNGDYIVTDPTDLHTSRIFRTDNYQLGYDHNNKAWCINEGDGESEYVSSVFYSKIEGLSTETGTFANPIWWDSEGVATSDRTITGDYNTGEAPYNEEEGYYEGWNFYVRLKAGTEYTIGMSVPVGDDYWFDWYFYLKDINGTTVATASEHDTSVTIGGKGINVYLTYTPTEDGLFVIQAQEEMNGLETPIACSPAPETSTQPPDELFEQTNWKVGGGDNAGFEVISAGNADCVQKFTQIAGEGIADDSVWQSEDGTLFCYIGYSYDTQRRWNIYTQNGYIGSYIYQSAYFDINKPKHPGAIVWNNRSSSSYGDYPVTKISEMPGVSGSPVLTPIEREGREELGYAIWSGEVMEQYDNGVWKSTGEVKSNMQTSRFVPIPGNIYNATGDVKAEAYKGIKGALYSWGETNYGCAKQHYVPELLTDLAFEKIAAGARLFFGIDKDGYMYSCGYNNYGQLGLGDTSTRYEPTKVNDKTWQQVSCGNYHAVAIDTDGFLWATGANSYGQLGDGTTTNKYTFVKIGDKKWKAVFCCDYATLLIDEDNYMWGVGSGAKIWGDGTTSSKSTLTKLNDKTWKSIFGSSTRTFAIDTDGYLWATGSNTNGSLGTGDSTDVTTFTQISDQRWKMVATASQHTIAINSEGYLYVWGTNNIGQLGTGDGEYHYTPFKNGNKKWRWVGAAYQASMAIDIYGKAYWFGGDSSYLTPYRANTPQPLNIPGNCTAGAVYDQSNMYVLTNE